MSRKLVLISLVVILFLMVGCEENKPISVVTEIAEFKVKIDSTKTIFSEYNDITISSEIEYIGENNYTFRGTNPYLFFIVSDNNGNIIARVQPDDTAVEHTFEPNKKIIFDFNEQIKELTKGEYNVKLEVNLGSDLTIVTDDINIKVKN